MILFILLIISIIVSFFILYILSKHDFVLVRKNISLAQIFDLAFVALFFAFIAGRSIYVLDYSQFNFFHFVRFFHLIKFSGISMLGFFIGGAVAVYFLFKNKKSLSRTFDIFSLAFFPAFIFNVLTHQYPANFFYIPIILSIILIVIFIALLRSHNRYYLFDGSISYFFLILVAFENFVIQLLDLKRSVFIIFSASQYLSVIIFIFALTALILNQKIFKNN